MIVPPAVRRGDAIAIVAPAGPVPEARFSAGLAPLQDRYDVRWSRRVFDETGYLAGDDAARARELELAIGDEEVRAIVCARGGYGVMRILSTLDPSLLARHPKPIVGFSDITALHALAHRAGVASIHGPVVTQLGELSMDDRDVLFTLLEGGVGDPLQGLVSVGATTTAAGPLVGGNLELVTRLVGTPWAFPLDGAVLLLEEVGERPYRIDRSLTQLSLSGALAKVAAVVVGDLVRCDGDDQAPTAEDVVVERLSRLGVPVLTGLPVGHGMRNRALWLGRTVRVDGRLGTATPI